MTSRLFLALTGGHAALPPHGAVLFLRPEGSFDFGGLDTDRVVAVQGFAPDHAALAARGIAVTPEGVAGDYVAAVVCMGKAKAETLQMIAQAMAMVPTGAPILVDGAKGDGVDSVLKLCRTITDVGPAYAKAHGKVFTIINTCTAPQGWDAGAMQADGFATRAGVFSADGIDSGSAALVAHMPLLKGSVCDLGAGWGYLSARALADNPDITGLDLVEADHAALSCARVNVTDPRAAFHWADARDWSGAYDCVISNPPFHIGRQAAPELGQAFIAAAGRLIRPRGMFLMVANRHLPYEKALATAFAEVEVLAETGGFKVVAARRPAKPAKHRGG